MRDPKRLREEPSLHPVERALLDSVEVPDPTGDQCDELWGALAQRLAMGAGMGATTHVTNGPGAAAGSGTKTLGAAAMVNGASVVLLVGAVAGALVLAPSSARLAAPRCETEGVSQPASVYSAGIPEASGVLVEPPDAPGSLVERTPQSDPLPSRPMRRRGAAPARPAGSQMASPEGDSSMRAESALLIEARRALRSGDCGGALERIDQTERHFSRGVLVQEREAIAIEALWCAGRESEAAARATRFLRTYPGSLLIDRMRRFER